MDSKEDLKKIYSAAIEAVNPENAVKSHFKREGNELMLISEDKTIARYNLNNFKKIFVVGAGKATSPMAKAVENILGDLIFRGCISVKYGYTENLKKINIIEASHPIPDKMGIEGAKEIRVLLEEAAEDDLIISLISGGGSALLPLPPDSITLDEKRETTDLLLKSGASIHEINAVRKHLSLTKGGNLAKAAYPATVINLMISDVVGDNMDVIASGPFVPDNSTFKTAKDILEKYKLSRQVPKSVINYIESGIRGNVEENPKKESKVFSKITNLIVASNIIALKASKNAAEKLGYNSLILSSLIEGDTKDVAFWHSRIAKEILLSSNPIPRPACIISGGETTVIVKGKGLGGRNMEFAIQAARYIEGFPSILMASIGTDGTDGPTDAAGAFALGNTISHAGKNGIHIDEYINNNDSYHFFSKTGGLIVTGPTNTNVMDVRIIIVV